jgi:hypothetical protein
MTPVRSSGRWREEIITPAEKLAILVENEARIKKERESKVKILEL